MSPRNIATKTLILMLALAGASPLAAAERDRFLSEPTDVNPNFKELEAWKEQVSAQLPPWPKDADLVEFHTEGLATPFRYYIDTKSLSVDAQKIVRYTVVVESGSGARNVAHEGIRCTPNGQHRLYAYGVGGKFQLVADTQWHGLQDPGVPPYARDLTRFYLCVPLKFEPRPLKEMPRILSGRGDPGADSGFLPD
jgi:hypothetical protein